MNEACHVSPRHVTCNRVTWRIHIYCMHTDLQNQVIQSRHEFTYITYTIVYYIYVNTYEFICITYIQIQRIPRRDVTWLHVPCLRGCVCNWVCSVHVCTCMQLYSSHVTYSWATSRTTYFLVCVTIRTRDSYMTHENVTWNVTCDTYLLGCVTIRRNQTPTLFVLASHPQMHMLRFFGSVCIQYICICVYIYMNICTHIYMYINIHICVYACIYIYLYTYTHKYVFAFIYTYKYVWYTYTCTACICVFTHTNIQMHREYDYIYKFT